MSLPDGVRLDALKVHVDERGWLAEIFRGEWSGLPPVRQWNVTMSDANVLRGMHVHFKHTDYLTVIKGRISVAFLDLRPRSRTYRKSALIELASDRLAAIVIPNGVLHGFYHHDESIYVLGCDRYYSPGEDLYCRWNDPALGIAWPCSNPVVGERDRAAPSLTEVEAELRRLNVEFS